jgi:hypothetical protein
VQAINPKKDNQVENANTHGCVAVKQTGSLNGSVEMWRISTRAIMTRDQFTVLPMPDKVIKLLDKIALKDGITRKSVLFEDSRTPNDEAPELMTDDDSDDADEHEKGQTFKEIPAEKRSEGVSDVDIEDVEEGDDVNNADPEIFVKSDLEANEAREGGKVPEPQDNWVRRSMRLAREIGLVIETRSAKMRSTACQLSDGPMLVG